MHGCTCPPCQEATFLSGTLLFCKRKHANLSLKVVYQIFQLSLDFQKYYEIVSHLFVVVAF